MSARRREFDALYTSARDPWDMETSAYERAKYDATLAVLGDRYECALEVGCSIGVLSERLAGRCEQLVALDVSEVALARARERLATSPYGPRVTFRRAEVPGEWPEGRYDLVVLSEVLYFLEPDEVAALARLSMRDLAPDGTVVCVNWTGECDRTLDGDGAAEAFARAAHGLERTGGSRADRYRIDLFRRAAVPVGIGA